MYRLLWIKPTLGLSDGWAAKLLVSLWLALLELFDTEGQYVLLIVVLVIADFVTGVIAAKKRREPIRSLGFRQTCIKAVEYAVFLTTATAVANVFGVVGWLDQSAYFFLAMTELKSIWENLSGEGGWLEKFKQMVGQRLADQWGHTVDKGETK